MVSGNSTFFYTYNFGDTVAYQWGQHGNLSHKLNWVATKKCSFYDDRM